MTVEELIQKSKTLLNEGKLEDANIIFQKILKLDPTYYKAHINMGAISLKLG